MAVRRVQPRLPPPVTISPAMRGAWTEWSERPADPQRAGRKEDALRVEADRLGVRRTVLHDHLAALGRARWGRGNAPR
jgi:hypothetical protein